MAEREIVLRGETVITMDPDRPGAEAVGIREGRIAAVGSTAEVAAAVGEGAELVEAEGAILPAFIDAHHHYSMAVFDARSPDLHLPPGSSLDDLLGLVEEAVGAGGAGGAGPEGGAPGAGGGPWLRMQGYDPSKLREGRAPRAEELDEVCPDRPLLLIAYSFHDGCLNSRGLAEMGWEADSPDPPHGRLLRRRGRLTGEISEGALFRAEARSRNELVEDAADAWIADCEAHGRELLAAGIVRVGDTAVPPSLEPLYERAVEAGRLPVIVHRMPVAAASMIEPRLDGEPTGAGPARAPVGPAKIFLDGAERCALCFSKTQALRAVAGTVRAAVGGEGLAAIRASARLRLRRGPDGLLHAGMRFWEEDALDGALRQAADTGLQVAQHALGNEAIAMAVGALERAGAPLHRLPGHPRLEHTILLDPDLARRIADAGAIAVVQPFFVYDQAGDFISLTPPPPPILGLPLRTMLDRGVTLAGSSDYPVSHYDVLAAVRAAVTRRTIGGRVFEPEEAIEVEEVLRAYTAGSAAALGVAEEAGTLEVGKRADVVVLSEDPRRVDPDAIDELRVLRTYRGGELVYEGAGREG